MQLRQKSILPLVTLALLSSVCTSTQLRYNHNSQAKSLTSIYEQQVLDNLAMFMKNEDALPFFAVPKAGSADVTDSGALSASPLNGPARTVLSLTSLSRNNKIGWTTTPVTDPAKITLMRCA